MELTNENPWKLKGKIKFISCCDVLIATFGVVYSSYQMFDYYMYIGDKDGVSDIMKGPGHIPFYIFIWFTVVLQYFWVIVVGVVLFSAVSLEATETDPHTSIQKCACWLRTARFHLFAVFVKLCLQPILLILEKSTQLYGIFFGLAEFALQYVGSECLFKIYNKIPTNMLLHSFFLSFSSYI